MDLSLGSRPSTTLQLQPTQHNSRILYDIPCKVCQDHSSGKHYGIFACDGCAGFFKRSIRRNRQYMCKAKDIGGCLVDKTHRNQCRACRLSRCVEAGMNKDAVQHERGPRNSTIRRQMSLLYGEGVVSSADSTPPPSLVGGGDGGAYSTVTPLRTSSPLQAPPKSDSTPAEDATALAEADSALSNNSTDHHARFTSPCRMPVLPYLPLPQYGTSELYMPHLMSGPEALCESAARILFGNVEWAKYLPAFSSLPHRDQIVLLQESWRQLFVLSLAQTLLPVEVEPLLVLSGSSGETAEQMLPLLKEINQLRETVTKLRALRVDATEYMCLKWIVLFRTEFSSTSTSGRELQQLPSISLLQDQAQLTLFRYVAAVHPSQPIRLSRLLMLTAALRDTPQTLIERLFFRRTIRDIPIDRLITDMYKKNDM